MKSACWPSQCRALSLSLFRPLYVCMYVCLKLMKYMCTYGFGSDIEYLRNKIVMSMVGTHFYFPVHYDFTTNLNFKYNSMHCSAEILHNHTGVEQKHLLCTLSFNVMIPTALMVEW